ncbi:putative bifunctional diguanylate cyclase/phosphodiesterase [Dechloromonas denitrificans]|uniref:putative bifunctional diguanylate cyclase/phosphodiesterase n=1 Tax=Dechloromonas denitrificans TaxID=281362 RepID=UPI000A80043A|nr:EAL domain-containing protein [Dechloromonas denitrificans]
MNAAAPHLGQPPGELDGIAAEMGIDAAEIASRKAFLEFTEADAEQLRAIRGKLAAAEDGFADGFYAYLRQLPELAALLPDDATVARLKAAHGRYFASLTEGCYDESYVGGRLRVGMTHARIGLTPKWYVGAFRKYLSDMLGATWAAADGDFETFKPAFDALLKVVMLDLGLTLDTYIHADKRAIALRDRAIESSVNGIFIAAATPPDYRLTYVNAAFSEILDSPRETVLGQPCLCTGEDDGFALIRAAIAEGRDGYTTLSRPRCDGSRQWIELFLAPVRSDAGAISHFVGVLNDVTPRKEAEEQLAFLAHHDSLTGLPNRSLFEQRLRQALARGERRQGFALCFIDLDRFKLINDSLGHDAGDSVLLEVARRVGAVCRDGDMLARLAGDEFVILIEGAGKAEPAAAIANRVLAALSRPIRAGGREIDVGASLGLALCPTDGSDVDTLLRNADAAMYAAKAAGRNTFCFYDEAMNRQASQRLALEADLRRAVGRQQLELFYQPQIRAVEGGLAGVEALLRWHHPERGLVSPGEFIPLAEEVGIIAELGEWALREAAQQIVDWQRRGIAVPRVAVNLSPRQFHDADLAERLERILVATGAPPECIELEITESAAMQHPADAVQVLQRLRQRGIQVAMDDFGTGHSSLAMLRTLPLHVLKLDLSFVQHLPTSETDAAVAGAVVTLARQLGLSVVAEGVETEAQRQFLAGIGCDLLQGFLFARPMPVAQFESWLATTTIPPVNLASGQ